MSNHTIAGRPVEFDRETVLDALTDLFWQNGYECTSMAEITSSTGLSKSSIYSSFGSKRELFDMALARYQEMMFSRVEARLLYGELGLEDLHWYLNFQQEISESGAGHQGCMAINAAAELGYEDPEIVEAARNYRSRMRNMYTAALQRGVGLGEVDAAKIPQYVNLILATSMSGALMSRSGAPLDELTDFINAGRSLLESFRIEQSP